MGAVLHFTSLQQFDLCLAEIYGDYVATLPGQPVELVRRRFAEHGIFPGLGWSLLRFAQTTAIEESQPELLYQGLSRFIKCAHACWGYADEHGIHPGGYDYCALVIPTIYSALFGKSYLQAHFYRARKMSVQSYPAYMHAANLMVTLEHRDWPYAEKAIAKSQAFVGAKSTRKVDSAFVSIFLGLIAQEPERVINAITDFAKGYSSSDWGKNKPGTQSTFLVSIWCYAGFYLPMLSLEALYEVIPQPEHDFWQKVSLVGLTAELAQHHFAAPLEFLNMLPINAVST